MKIEYSSSDAENSRTDKPTNGDSHCNREDGTDSAVDWGMATKATAAAQTATTKAGVKTAAH